MKNLGLSDLCVVRPACDLGGDEARRMAVSAVNLLETARKCDHLSEAIGDVETVVGTSARHGKQRRPHWSVGEFCDEVLPGLEQSKLALLFGREDHGMSDVDLDHCTHLVYLPASEGLTSFNLSQAVLLVGWELRRHALASAAAATSSVSTGEKLAQSAEREAFFGHLTEALLEIGFTNEQTSESIMRRMRRIYGRAQLSVDELSTLRGMARQMLWAARQKDES
jgi:TrmH family RNA methyltransferase